MTTDDQRTRNDYPYFREIQTRWKDNDIYGHVNNIVYYEYIDTVVNGHMIDEGGFDIHNDPAIGIIPETRCRYLKPLSHPEILDAGLRVTKLGRTSVVYEIGLFRRGEDDPAAIGYFVHVFVERAAQHRTTPIPDKIRRALSRLCPSN